MSSNDNETPVVASYPDDNPKTIHGIAKVPLHLVPPSAKIALAEAFADGAAKYGPYNWREKTVSASVYIAAAQRHMDRWWDRSDPDDRATDSLVHHIDHAMACLAIIKDGLTIGKINDDRPLKGAAGELQDAYANKNKKEKHDTTPAKHSTIFAVPTAGLTYDEWCRAHGIEPSSGRCF